MSTDALFSVAEVWQGDPVHPGLDAPTPLDVVVMLSRSDRRQRVRALTDQAHEIYDNATTRYVAGRVRDGRKHRGTVP